MDKIATTVITKNKVVVYIWWGAFVEYSAHTLLLFSIPVGEEYFSLLGRDCGKSTGNT